jgi:multiple sugar transport system permease protein
VSAAAPAGQTPLWRAGGILIGLLILLWTLMPIYNMVAVSLETSDAVSSNQVFPAEPSLFSFVTVFTQDYWYLQNFWRQMLNSLIIGVATAAITLAVASTASYAIQRLRVRFSGFLVSAALLTYVIPASFLAIPFYKIMHEYGLSDNLWSVILVEVTFATPYAIFIFQQYGASIPGELDEAAIIDGASRGQIFFRIYLPLMAPALVAVGTYALLLAWNEYLYAFLLLSTETKVTVPVALGFFLSSDEAPWNLLMAAAIIYSLPPLAIYYVFRRYMSAGLTMGGVKA